MKLRWKGSFSCQALHFYESSERGVLKEINLQHNELRKERMDLEGSGKLQKAALSLLLRDIGSKMSPLFQWSNGICAFSPPRHNNLAYIILLVIFGTGLAPKQLDVNFDI